MNKQEYNTEVTRIYPKLLAIASRVALPDTAEDTLQDALLKGYANLNDFHGNSSLSTWLTKIMMNITVDQVRASKSEQSYIKESIAHRKDNEEDGEADPSMILEALEGKDKYDKRIERLTEVHRTAQYLIDRKGLTYEEVQVITDVPLGTVKTRVKKAREILSK